MRIRSAGADEASAAPAPRGTIQMCGVLVLASRLTSTTLKITHLPSGETSGSPTRFSFIMSSNVKGCLAWANAENARQIRASEAKKKRCMDVSWGKRKSLAGFGVAPPPRRCVAVRRTVVLSEFGDREEYRDGGRFLDHHYPEDHDPGV